LAGLQSQKKRRKRKMKQTTAQTHSTSRNEFIRKVFEEDAVIALLKMIGLPGLKVVKDEEKLDG